ncbi:hypothetical protein [Desulfofustis glycolicus]|uniref:Uncharacterized protein n=1 Tax=Desulfofustis glycolicus DSM 9705 TaxID=1121409 RepID=A0A1M5U4M7_9BACT|nr:hypothetical protein [Desulfofustis glycolicus]MCB2214656.1 hypothetical protein [Desulfobulbaceae bacterium]SHH57919.1 hypothetical protein SAMN02745124_01002 [Desulfofustis glycolicus DSM 9705]
MKAKDTFPIGPLIAILFLGSSLLFQPSSGWAEPADFAVFFSGNVFGELEACGG